MARVEIEERAWSDSRLKKLANGLNLTPSLAMGILAALWHDSQNEQMLVTTEEDLVAWFSAEIAAGHDVLGMLQASGYIEKTEDGRYRIDGNKTRIQKVNHYRSKAKTAAAARWSKSGKTRKSKSVRDVPNDATSNAQASEKSSTQASLKQCHNNMTTRQHDNETTYVQTPSVSAPATLERADASCEAPRLEDVAVPNEATKVVNQTCPQDDKIMVASDVPRRRRSTIPAKHGSASESKSAIGNLIAHFVNRWGAKHTDAAGVPTRYPVAGKDAGAAKAIVKAVGIDRAKELVEVYLGMRTTFLVTRRHPLWAMANDLPALMDFAATGRLMTTTAARREETTAANTSVIDRMIAKEQVKHQTAETIDVEARAVSNDAPW